jgi:hypothetical protein
MLAFAWEGVADGEGWCLACDTSAELEQVGQDLLEAGPAMEQVDELQGVDQR